MLYDLLWRFETITANHAIMRGRTTAVRWINARMVRTNVFAQDDALIEGSRAHRTRVRLFACWQMEEMNDKPPSNRSNKIRRRKNTNLYGCVRVCAECRHRRMPSNRIDSRMVVRLQNESNGSILLFSNERGGSLAGCTHPCGFACVFAVSSANRMFCRIRGTEIAVPIYSCASVDGSSGCGHRQTLRRKYCMSPICCDAIACADANGPCCGNSCRN